MSVKPFPDMDWIKGVCRIGQGNLCCRYLTMGPQGWGCEKHSSLRHILDTKVAAGEMNARGDNCDGETQ